MAGSMQDYLPAVTADYSATQLDIAPQRIMGENASFSQDAVEFDDESVAVVTKSTTPKFIVTLQWDALTKADADTIMDFFCDVAKAKGKARSFEWPHPTDGNTYIAHFWDDMERNTEYLYAINQIRLKVIGYKAT